MSYKLYSLEVWAFALFTWFSLALSPMHQKLFSQRFTVAEFSSIFCFVFIFRCSIFKVQFAAFFSMLLNSLAATACLLYHIFFLLSSAFFDFFEVFSTSFVFHTCHPDSLTIISQLFRFVKGFCKSFLGFLSGLCDSMIVASFLRSLLLSLRQLCYYITYLLFCQSLFGSFSLFTNR